jgi:hypothetical protein
LMVASVTIGRSRRRRCAFWCMQPMRVIIALAGWYSSRSPLGHAFARWKEKSPVGGACCLHSAKIWSCDESVT